MLYIIGLGLGNEKDITLRGLEAVKKCKKLYMEAYTSLLSFGLSSGGLSKLEQLYVKLITVADREMVEEKSDDMLEEARDSDVSFLVVGDPFGEDTIYVGMSRQGSEDQQVVVGSMKQLLKVDFGQHLHCLVIAGETHPVEDEMLRFYSIREKLQ